ncbi:hypothetical protein [Actinoallomurus sp. NPDC052274]|uniref:hypothetical protein n=1 Tax=Actinoallomurus sp. NPDC052274 TaxID=3155420 RepID=UPI003448444D
MAPSRAVRDAEEEPADGGKKRGSSAGGAKSRPAAGRKRSTAAGGRKKSGAAGARKKSGAAGARKTTRPATRRKRSATKEKRIRHATAGSPLSVLLVSVGVLVAMGVIALAGWLLTFPLDDFRYSSGLSGTQGTFTAVRCHATGSGKDGSRVCTGTFVPAKGGSVDSSARVRDARIEVGKPVTVRRKTDGGYVRPGAANAGTNLATAFGIVALAAFLLVVLCVAPKNIKVGGLKRLRQNPPPWGTLLSIFVPLFGASLVLAALSALLGHLLALIF